MHEDARVTVKSLCETIWRLETEHGLLDRRVWGVHYWPLIRSELFYALSHRLGLHERLLAADTLSRRVLNQIVAPIRDAGILPWRRDEPVDTILIPFGRKHVRNGRIVDIISDRVLTEPGFGRVMVLDSAADAGIYQSGKTWIVRSRDAVRSLAHLRAEAILPLMAPLVKAEQRLLTGALRRELGVDFPWSLRNFAKRIALFREGRALSLTLVRRSGARRLFIVGGHGATGAVAAAIDEGLETLEFQHGILTPYHPVYHYPGRPFVPYAPARLLTFGAFWGENVELPRNTTATVVGSGQFACAKAPHPSQTAQRVLMISQGTIGPALLAAAVVAAKQAPGWTFHFRPHPQENFNAIREDLRAMPDRPSNLHLSPLSDDLYDLLASVELQIGVYSTAIFEGMAMGLRTIVLALPGAEHMMRAVTEGDAVMAQEPAEIARLLDTAPRARRPEEYFRTRVPSLAAAIG